jgi:hypothetical protein
VDPVLDASNEPGVVAAAIYTIRPDEEVSFLTRSGPVFESFRRIGLREVTVLRSLEANNTFSQLPIRTDGSFVVWVGIAPRSAALDLDALDKMDVTRSPRSVESVLRSPPEVVILDPTRRSRLRWRADWFADRRRA